MPSPPLLPLLQQLVQQQSLHSELSPSHSLFNPHTWQLAGLAQGHKGDTKSQSQGGTKDEATRLKAWNVVHQQTQQNGQEMHRNSPVKGQV